MVGGQSIAGGCVDHASCTLGGASVDGLAENGLILDVVEGYHVVGGVEVGFDKELEGFLITCIF